jgi:sugar lactone lactonase YvrE
MYYIDSGSRRVDVCDYDALTGEVTNRTPFVQLSTQSVEPDGLTVDSDGCVWVALWGGGAVHRYGPDGSLDRVVELPALNITNCTFGGDDLKTLYITSASIQTTPEQSAIYPLSGAVFAITPGVQGLPTNEFAG